MYRNVIHTSTIPTTTHPSQQPPHQPFHHPFHPFLRQQHQLLGDTPPKKQFFIHFLARSEKTNQKRGVTPKAPYIGGCNLLRAETALRKGSCVPSVASDQRSSVGKFYEAFALKGKTWIFYMSPLGCRYGINAQNDEKVQISL